MLHKKVSEEEKYMQNQNQLERELIRLKKEFGILEKSRTQGQYAKGSSLIKLSKVIDLFKKEHQNILDDLGRATDSGKERQDIKIFENLSKTLEDYDDVDNKVEKHKLYIKEIEEEIKLVQKSVHQWQKQQTTDRQHQERVLTAIQTVEALDNKLETQMIKFGTICTNNKMLREQIDHLLWDRKNFLRQWTSFIKKLTEGKRIMLDLIEQASIAYNQREECCTKLRILRAKASVDFTNHCQEMIQFRRKLAGSWKLKQFMLIKGQKRVMEDLEAKFKEKRNQQKLILEQKIEKYEDMLTHIKVFAKEENIMNISRNFITQDEENLSKFKYIIDLIREMELVGDDLAKLQRDIDAEQFLHHNRGNQQQNALTDLETELEHIRTEAHTTNVYLEKTESYYNNLLEGVEMLFKLCQCDKDPLFKLLGENNNVKFYNVEFYLKLLESRIQQLLLAAGYSDALGEKRKGRFAIRILETQEVVPKIYSIEAIIRTTPCSLCVEHEMVTDVIETLQEVVTRDKAKELLRYHLKLPGGPAKLHNISNCQLPKSRGIMQKRYQ